MLIWKTQADNVRIASNRYRCLFPIKYLKKAGYNCLIYSGKEYVSFHLKPTAIIFVKSFTPHDLSLAQTASKLGIPIILDICDNILVEGYAFQSAIKPQEFFLEMAKLASAIVTTGEALKFYLEEQLNSNVQILIVPDGNETLEDFEEYIDIVKANVRAKTIAYALDPYSILRQSHNIYQKIELTLKNQKKALAKSSILKPRKLVSKLKSKVRGASSYFQKQITTYSAELEPINIVDIQDSSSLAETSSSELLNLSSAFKLPDRTNEAKIDINLKQIVWFGNHGVKPGIGMLALLNIQKELEKIYQEVGFCLHVVSDNYDKYCQYIEPLPFPTRYTQWEFFTSRECISRSDVTILPTSIDAFNICKSPNRAVLSLSLGVPVVATKTPALVPLQDCLVLDNWYDGIIAYLTDPELVNSHITKAREIIEQDYSGEAIARQWSAVIERVAKGKV